MQLRGDPQDTDDTDDLARHGEGIGVVLTRHRIMAVAVASLAVVASLAACSSSSKSPAGQPAGQTISATLPPSVLSSKTLIVGSPEQNPPVIYKNGDQVEGLGADLINAVAAALGLHVQFVNTAFPGLFAALNTGKIDVIAGIELADTEQREGQGMFISHDVATGSLLIPKANPHSIQSAADLCGLTAGTLQGSNYAGLLATQSSHCTSSGKQPITIKLYPDAPSTLTQLQAGRLDAFMADLPYSRYIAKTVDNGNAVAVAATTFPNGVDGLAVKLGNTALATAIQAALKQIISDGRYQSVYTKYGLSEMMLPADEVLVNGVGSGAFTKYMTPTN